MIETVTIYFSLILARVGTFVLVMPLFADRAPRRVRAGLALALAVFYFSAVGPQWDPTLTTARMPTLVFAVALGREALIGGVLGFAFSLFLLPAQLAGSFVSQQVGLPGGPPATTGGRPTPSSLALTFEVLASVIFLELDCHHVLLTALHSTFAHFPLGGTLMPQPVAPMLDGLARAHELALLLAAPLAVCLVLVTIVLAFMARVAPQLNIYTIGFTMQAIVVLLGFAFLLPDTIFALASFMRQTGPMVLKVAG